MCEGARVLHSDRGFNFGLARQKKMGQSPLDEFEARLGRHDFSDTATLLFNIERCVFLDRGQFVQDIGEGGRLDAEERGKTFEVLNEFKTG